MGNALKILKRILFDGFVNVEIKRKKEKKQLYNDRGTDDNYFLSRTNLISCDDWCKQISRNNHSGQVIKSKNRGNKTN